MKPQKRQKPRSNPQKNRKKQVRERAGGRFIPGVSGNPKGRPPKGYSLTALLREAGRDLQSLRINRKTIEASKAELLTLKLWAIALRGDVKAMQLVFERMEGSPKLRVELETAYAKLEELEKMIAKLEAGK